MKLKNRQFYCYKFNSDRLKKFGYDIEINFNQAKINGEIIAIADNQILRTIRDIKHINFNKQVIESLYKERDEIKKLPTSKSNVNKLKSIQAQINHLLFVPEYVTIVMDRIKHYEHIFYNGLKINGVNYKRLSCSAGQARNSTVLFCSETIIEEVKERLNNERDLTKPIAPSKLNAYFGLYSSATQLVTEPRFIVIPDYNNTVEFEANFVEETDYALDDIVTRKTVQQEMNRTDGQGLISPRMAEIWSKDLGLDYIPSQFVIRQSFLKGLVCTFDIHEFCKEKNNENYLIKTIYKDENGNHIYKDIRNYDMILSESQFKLWDSYKNEEDYINKYRINKLYWGVSQYSPEEANDVVNLNYQFIQTIDLDKKDIEDLCSLFVELVEGVSVNNVDYSLLFLTGQNNTEKRIQEYLKSWDVYWIKSLIVNRESIKDKYIRSKIYEYIKNTINRACLGIIPVYGNYQYIISDPYAYMEHVCELEINGLLKKDEHFSNYWNLKNVKLANGMRAPLTHYSEHTLLHFIDNGETKKWYRYCNTGIILNWFGYESCKFAGSDFDGDLLCSVSNKEIIEGVKQDEIPVVYTPQKPTKIIPTEEDLYKFDLFGMGSMIGQLTNKGASAIALLENLKEKYGEDSLQYNLTNSRIQQVCKAQSTEIDKTKLGREVKGIPPCWITRIGKKDEETEKEKISREFFNELLLDKRPYFFQYLYNESKKEFKEYNKEQNEISFINFSLSLEQLLNSKERTEEQEEFVQNYYEWCPLIISNSCMNILCSYIENFNFTLRKKTKMVNNDFDYSIYKNNSVTYSKQKQRGIIQILKDFRKKKQEEILSDVYAGLGNKKQKERSSLTREEKILYNIDLTDLLFEYCSNEDIVLNVLIDYFYKDNPDSDKEILWVNFGKQIFNNVQKNTKEDILYPFPDEEGNIKYLGKSYSLRKVEREDIK